MNFNRVFHYTPSILGPIFGNSHIPRVAGRMSSFDMFLMILSSWTRFSVSHTRVVPLGPLTYSIDFRNSLVCLKKHFFCGLLHGGFSCVFWRRLPRCEHFAGGSDHPNRCFASIFCVLSHLDSTWKGQTFCLILSLVFLEIIILMIMMF